MKSVTLVVTASLLAAAPAGAIPDKPRSLETERHYECVASRGMLWSLYTQGEDLMSVYKGHFPSSPFLAAYTARLKDLPPREENAKLEMLRACAPD